jgi:hypothetical protein
MILTTLCDVSATTAPQRIAATVPLDTLRLSRFNARTTRPAASITALAERMRRNGFESSRALWVVPLAEDRYEVFAGGTRLAAAREAALTDVPVLVHAGYNDTDISRLADEDNENDEYHVPVPLPDIWAEYRRLKEKERWTGRRIAAAKQKPEGLVSERLQYALFPLLVRTAFFKNAFLNEGHARELLKVSKFEAWTPWITRDQVMSEIVEQVLEKHRGGSQNLVPTATVFGKAVTTYNGMITEAQQALAAFPEKTEDEEPLHPRRLFLEALAAKNVRTAKDVITTAGMIALQVQAHQAAYLQRLTARQEAAQREAARLEAERQRRFQFERLLASFQHGDNRTLIPTHCPSGIRLIVTDPPYGKGFQSKRRVVTSRTPVLEGDATLEQACTLLHETLTLLQPKLAADVHLFLCTHQDSYCAFLQVLGACGWTIRRTMTWMKGQHGLGDTTRGEVLTQTEWIIHAVQGNPKFTEDVDRPELLDFPGDQETEHPHEKPVPLCEHLIGLATEPGDVVIDPFAGSASTVVAGIQRQRRLWGCERDEDYYRLGAQRVEAAARRVVGMEETI